MTGIEHLREFVRTFHGCPSDVCRYTLTSIADQISREQADRSDEVAETFRREVSEAYAWVRDHGGLEAVSADWTGHVPLRNVRRMVELHKEKRDRLKAHALWLERKCRERRERIEELNKAVAEMRPRLMPEGMKWPRFEDGEPVRVGDEFSVTVHDEDGDFERSMTADSISFGEHGIIVCDPRHLVRLLSGERVRRPAVLASDGEPLREGEHVYHVETGAELVVKELPKPGAYQAVVVFAPPASHLTSFDPDRLTHERPVADSWERLEEDATIEPHAYCAVNGLYGAQDENDAALPASEMMARDIVRRARALAGDA